MRLADQSEAGRGKAETSSFLLYFPPPPQSSCSFATALWEVVGAQDEMWIILIGLQDYTAPGKIGIFNYVF